MLSPTAGALVVCTLVPSVAFASTADDGWSTRPNKPVVAAAARWSPPRPPQRVSPVDPRFGTKPVLWARPQQTTYDPRPAHPDPNFGKKPVLWTAGR